MFDTAKIPHIHITNFPCIHSFFGGCEKETAIHYKTVEYRKSPTNIF